MDDKRHVNRIGIVFSGGFARGVAQIAFASSLVKKIGKDRIKVISGSSIGALNAYAVSCGTQEKLMDAYANFEMTSSILSFRKTLKNGLYIKFFKKCEGTEMIAPTYVTTSRLFPFDLYYIELNKLPRLDQIKVIDLSMAFPIINGPKLYRGKLYLDGGTANNVPIYPLEYYDLDMIIVVHCYPKYYPPSSVLRDDRIFIDVDCTLSLDKSISPFSLDKISIDKMIESGKKAGKEFADQIFSDFVFDNVKERCFEYTRNHVEERKKKVGGILALVDYPNAIFSFKE